MRKTHICWVSVMGLHMPKYGTVIETACSVCHCLCSSLFALWRCLNCMKITGGGLSSNTVGAHSCQEYT